MSQTIKSFISDTILSIEQSVRSGVFLDVERSGIELKDLSTGGDWTSLKETVCAFLNTNGGLIICGVRERENNKVKEYSLTYFNRKNENNIIELQSKVFQNDLGQYPDLSDYINFEYYPIADGDVLVVVVLPLSNDLKYLYYQGKARERKLTQDKVVPDTKIKQHQEYKQELEHSKELSSINEATIGDLSLDKINTYVTLYNREIRHESLKPSLQKAIPFLVKEFFYINQQVSVLGMLVCGEDPFHFLNSRAEVNCYYDTSDEIGKDRKIFRNDVIALMEDTFKYIWGHIKIARVASNGGKAEPEYPERLIREVINNALAHRDYTINKFVTVTIEPNQYVEIKNPGSFKERMKIVSPEHEVPVRRLIPGGMNESKNPKLASVLKVFDKIEGLGNGMTFLVKEALENRIDLPYYALHDGWVTLRIPSGKLVDDAINAWLNGFGNYIETKLKKSITTEHKAILAYFYKSQLLNKNRYYTILLSESNNHFSAVEDLSSTGLLLEHPVSTEEKPIYVLDPVLTKIDFSDIFMDLIGPEFIQYDSVAKNILHIVYRYTKYNRQTLKAADITPEVYRNIYGKVIDPKKFESLGRKVRKLCNELQERGLLTKTEQNGFTFVDDYITPRELF
jgi:predicted HTH transcriptional regulator